MSLTINNNLMAANVARNLSASFGLLHDSVRRLSSGLRISRAADDAAGLAVRELMRADIAGLHQGVRNANDAISMIQTADGALQVIDEKLIRMKELAEQAATGTYNSDQRLIIDSEYQAMASEITRIADATDFNGIHLLNGNLSQGSGAPGLFHDGTGLRSIGPLKVHFGTRNDCAEDYYYIAIGSATSSALGLSGGYLEGLTEAQYAAANGLTATGFSNNLNIYLGGISGEPAYWGTDFDQTQVVRSYLKAGVFHLFATRDNGDLYVLRANNATGDYISDGVIASPAAPGISTQQTAQQALVKIESAIISKDKIRASLGALQNRLENTLTNLQIQAENMQAAESRISDVDVSREMTEFVRRQILSQSAVAMLAQANTLPRMALQLLGR